MKHAKRFGARQLCTMTRLSGLLDGQFDTQVSYCVERPVSDGYRPRHDRGAPWHGGPRLAFAVLTSGIWWYRQGLGWPSPEHTRGMNRWIKQPQGDA